VSKIAAIAGRILLALIFIFSGANKLMDVAGTEQMIQSVGLPGGYAIAVGIFELAAGVMLVIGFMVRLVAILLFVFVAATILFFHNQFSDPMQSAIALKNLAIMGGLLLAFAHSQMWSHYYALRAARRGDVAKHEVEQRLHEAEVRTARAEALAEAAQTPPVGQTAVADTSAVDTPEVYRSRRRWFDW